jgi:transcriptional regulator with XRE-family HTH domain
MAKEVFDLVRKEQDDDGYWFERAKIQFALGLEERRRELKWTYKAVADKIGASGPYVSKVFRGDTNLTIESMVKFARALGAHLELKVGSTAPALTAPTNEDVDGVVVPAFDLSVPADEFVFDAASEPEEDVVAETANVVEIEVVGGDFHWRFGSLHGMNAKPSITTGSGASLLSTPAQNDSAFVLQELAVA